MYIKVCSCLLLCHGLQRRADVLGQPHVLQDRPEGGGQQEGVWVEIQEAGSLVSYQPNLKCKLNCEEFIKNLT